MKSEPIQVFSGLSVARLKRAVRLGVKSLWLHRLRSLLTALGIVGIVGIGRPRVIGRTLVVDEFDHATDSDGALDASCQ
jgi:hypothetical protein